MSHPEKLPPHLTPEALERGREAAKGIFLASGGARENLPTLQELVERRAREQAQEQAQEQAPKPR